MESLDKRIKVGDMSPMFQVCFPQDNQGGQLRGQGVRKQCGGVKGQGEAGTARASIHGGGSVRGHLLGEEGKGEVKQRRKAQMRHARRMLWLHLPITLSTPSGTS